MVEGPAAGGHNAPPRGELRLSDRGEPLYGDRAVVDLSKLRELSLPFWLAGGAGSPEGRRAALAAGAAGIQVGTLFAYCDESGLAPNVKRRALDAAAAGELSVRTDPRASPTGYPFKIVELPDDRDPAERSRICDIGLLRTPARTAEGQLVYRCPAEPIDAYVAKGGMAADALGRRCLCNDLVASVGLPQSRAGGEEQPSSPAGTISSAFHDSLASAARTRRVTSSSTCCRESHAGPSSHQPPHARCTPTHPTRRRLVSAR